MANEEKKDFNAMLAQDNGMPRIQIVTDPATIRRYGGSRMYFAPPRDYDRAMRQVPPGFIHSELAREIREACALCPAIDRADDFSFSREGRLLHVTFSVTLKTTGETMEVSEIVG